MPLFWRGPTLRDAEGAKGRFIEKEDLSKSLRTVLQSGVKKLVEQT
jgi:hypothetical protein